MYIIAIYKLFILSNIKIIIMEKSVKLLYMHAIKINRVKSFWL